MSDPAKAAQGPADKNRAGNNRGPAPASTDQAVIRNFCIIAHIDHGKSTLADRMLQLTGIVEGRQMRAQYLDRMDIERERGITIKSQAVRLPWKKDGTHYVLNMIDTPGHVDFTYEVSRSLEACEGAVLLVDAAQGIEAQTLANLYLAINADLKIIPVLNKIDLPAAQPERYAEELSAIIGCDPSEVLRVSAKTGEGVKELLDTIVDQVPHPRGDPDAPARALIFDSVYDTYRGVVTYVRVVDGKFTKRERILMMSTQSVHETLELGVISPEPIPSDGLGAGEVGYLISGVKDVRQARVGDTVTTTTNKATDPLAGYDHPKPMVFSGLYPVDGDEYPELREALDKLQLNDAALVYEPETSTALGFGFRCGFLGLLHMEIVRERLEREFDLSLISTAPNVVYRVVMESGRELTVTNPSDFPGGIDGFSRSAEQRSQGQHRREDQGSLRADRPGDDHLTERLHRHDHGTVPGQARHPQGHGLPVHRPGRDPLHDAARRDHLRLLRPAQVQDKGLREPRLRAGRRAGRQPGQGGHPAPGPAGGRVQPDRALRQRPRVRPVDDRQAQGAHTAAAVRGPHPGRRRQQDHRAGRTSAPCARTCSPSATAVTSPASGSCSRSRRKARSG